MIVPMLIVSNGLHMFYSTLYVSIVFVSFCSMDVLQPITALPGATPPGSTSDIAGLNEMVSASCLIEGNSAEMNKKSKTLLKLLELMLLLP